MTPKAYLVTGAARGIGATIEVLMSAIADTRATTVAIPLEAPQRHANGTHWGRFVRTIIEVIDTEGGVLAGARWAEAANLLGGAIREQVSFASYLFYRYENEAGTAGGWTHSDEIVHMAR